MLGELLLLDIFYYYSGSVFASLPLFKFGESMDKEFCFISYIFLICKFFFFFYNIF